MYLKPFFISIIFCLTPLLSNAQKEQIHIVKGQVISFKKKIPLSGAHILNLNSVTGSITNKLGFFEIKAKTSDTIYFSYVGFSSIKLKVTNDLLKGNDLVISLYQKSNELAEVVVKTHNLIGVLEIDAKNVPKDKYNRIHINGLPQTYETGRSKPKVFDSPIDAIFNPLDFLYNRFGKKPRELRKLKKLQQEDNLRAILNTHNREILMEYLNLNITELNELLNECNYSNYFIKNASDLQIINAVLDCYENHKALKNGSTKK